ncbi:MAG: hypothetical protein CBD09_00600 [Puniceicoccaceae bacterium TMED149]|nr:MAG: hypothetical protein CBD09_00600 [Puniceicoccaceae bacterium TMED149]|tara:strand:- start:77 stop:742 length:666 start_codon:yes stop_codon:yes gene_type:complete
MKLSQRTNEILKNFSGINNSLLFNEGSVLRTVTEGKTLIAKAKVDESFPRQFAIYDLNQFLGSVSLLDDPDFDFGESSLTAKNGSGSIRYFYADPSMITTAPKKDLNLPSVEVQFKLSAKTLKSVLQAANVLGLPEVIIQGDGSSIRVGATNTKNDTSNAYSYEVGETNKTFRFIYKVENLKLILTDYLVSVSEKGITHFTNDDDTVQYWVANEVGSTYDN